MGTLARTIREYKDDNLTDWAAALTYYSVLSLFPALIVLVALLGLLGQYPETVNAIVDIARQLGPNSAAQSVEKVVSGVVQNKGGAGALFSFGLLGALWSASGYVGAFMRASSLVYEVEQRRAFRNLPVRLLITVVMLLLVAVIALALVLSGPLAAAVGSTLGLTTAAVTAWSIAKWPVLLLLVMIAVALLYYLAPNVRQGAFRLLSPGAVLAVLVWILVSVAFALYVANFGSYNQTYGSLGAVIVFLVWLYLTNNALLLGLELNAERERTRELRSGVEAEEQLQVEPRDRR